MSRGGPRNFDAFSLSLRLQENYLNQEELPASIACSVVATSPAIFKLEIFILVLAVIIIIMKKTLFLEKKLQ